jgi:hypothetical protein
VLRPETDLPAYRTFSVLEPPTRDDTTLEADHPMRARSESNRELRDAIADGLRDRGYRADDDHPDLLVAYYASQTRYLDVTQWNYGYGCRLQWWRLWEIEAGFTETALPPGTVIIDVLEATTGDVLWRGFGVAVTNGGALEYRRSLRTTVKEVVAQLPGRP